MDFFSLNSNAMRYMVVKKYNLLERKLKTKSVVLKEKLVYIKCSEKSVGA